MLTSFPTVCVGPIFRVVTPADGERDACRSFDTYVGWDYTGTALSPG
jgi:hypothetical protein